MKKLYLSNTDKKLGGVCGGLGKYLGVDPTIIRILFVIFTLCFGSGILIYLVMWLIVPREPEK